MHVPAPEVAFVFGPKCHFRLGVCKVQRIARLGQVMKVATQWAKLIKIEETDLYKIRAISGRSGLVASP